METLQPKIRFPEFEGDWQNVKLDTFTKSISSGKSKSRESEGEYFLYGSTGIIGYTDENDYNGECILIARVGANAGNLYKVDGNYSVTDNTLMLYTNEDSYFDFTYYLLIKEGLNKLVFGSGQPLITGGQLKSLNLSVPKIEEQTRIANFLSSVDEKLNLLKEKKALLEDYKKGIMQKIFNQEIRLKDDKGNDFEDWDEKPLGEIIKEVSEKTTITNQYKIVSSTVKGLIYQDEYFNRDIASKDNSGYKIIRLNNLVLSPQNLWMGNINFNDKFPVGIVSPSYKIFEFNLDIVIPLYCKYYLLTDLMIKKYEQCSVMGASVVRRSLDINLFYELNIFLPSIAEQTKIANLLSAIDEKIELVSNQIQDTQEYKKGLLQQMFV